MELDRYVLVGWALTLLMVVSALTPNLFESSVAVEADSSVTDNDTLVYVDPQACDVALGSTFTVNISITDVVSLFSYEFKMYYDTALLDGIQVEVPEGHFLEPIGLGYIFIVKLEVIDDFNSTHGRVFVAASLLNPEPAKTGSGVLATVTFQAMKAGSCILDLHEPEMIFVNDRVESIPFEVNDGHFQCETAAHEVAVFLEVPRHLVPGETTKINASVQNGGHTDETNVMLQLLIGGTMVDAMEISLLPVGSSHTISYGWTPLDEGQYNVIADASSLAGEDNTANNVKLKDVVVSHVIDVPFHFSTIQEAIHASSVDDTIRVASGTYYEHLVIDKPVTLVGENANTTFIDGRKVFRVVEILQTGQGCKVSGVTVQRGVIGIYVDSDNNLIENNMITECEAGFYLVQYVSGNIIRRNTITSNDWGIFCDIGSHGNTIYHNNFIDNANQTIDKGSNNWDFKDEGNYWSDYNGTDTDEDDIGDVSYEIDVTQGAWDYAPLVVPYCYLLGDLNDDSEVNISDLRVAAAAWGSYPRHPRWNTAADITSDGKVNMIDMVLIAKNFGK